MSRIPSRSGRALHVQAEAGRALPRPHLRVPDERPRLREAREPPAPRRLARRRRRRSRRPAADQHLLDPREGRAPPLQRPRRAARVEGGAPGPRARCRRLRRAAGRRRAARAASRSSTSCSAPTTCASCPPSPRPPAPASAPRASRRRAPSSASTSPRATPPSPGRGRRSAYLTVMEGCDMFCTFCIVPRTRGREISRPAAGILAEAEALAARGVREVILLGQTVNAYGRHDLRKGTRRTSLPFAELLAAHRGRPRHRSHPLHEPAPDLLRRRADPRPRRARRRSARTCTCRRRAAPTPCSRACAAATARDDLRAPRRRAARRAARTSP